MIMKNINIKNQFLFALLISSIVFFYSNITLAAPRTIVVEVIPHVSSKVYYTNMSTPDITYNMTMNMNFVFKPGFYSYEYFYDYSYGFDWLNYHYSYAYQYYYTYKWLYPGYWATAYYYFYEYDYAL